MKNESHFDFDAWMALAKTDPDAFEAQRTAFLNRFISDLPERARQRLTRVQWRVDMERQRCKNPIESATRIYDMMWDSLSQTHEELCGLVALIDPDSEYAKPSIPAPKAKVLRFAERTGTES